SPLHDAAAARSETAWSSSPAPPCEVARMAPAITPPSTTPVTSGSRHRIGVQLEGITGGIEEARSGSDHRRVVGTEVERGGPGAGKCSTQLGIRRDPADDRDPLRAEPLRGCERLLDQSADDRPLVRGGKVGSPALLLSCIQVAHGVEQRGLYPRK